MSHFSTKPSILGRQARTRFRALTDGICWRVLVVRWMRCSPHPRLALPAPDGQSGGRLRCADATCLKRWLRELAGCASWAWIASYRQLSSGVIATLASQFRSTMPRTFRPIRTSSIQDQRFIAPARYQHANRREYALATPIARRRTISSGYQKPQYSRRGLIEFGEAARHVIDSTLDLNAGLCAVHRSSPHAAHRDHRQASCALAKLAPHHCFCSITDASRRYALCASSMSSVLSAVSACVTPTADDWRVQHLTLSSIGELEPSCCKISTSTWLRCSRLLELSCVCRFVCRNRTVSARVLGSAAGPRPLASDPA